MSRNGVGAAELDAARSECERLVHSGRCDGEGFHWRDGPRDLSPQICECHGVSFALLPCRVPDASGDGWCDAWCVAMHRAPEWKGTGLVLRGTAAEAREQLDAYWVCAGRGA